MRIDEFLAQEDQRGVGDFLSRAFGGFLVATSIAVVFGVVYWLIRRGASKRDEEKRRAWIEERRAKRAGEKGDAPPEA